MRAALNIYFRMNEIITFREKPQWVRKIEINLLQQGDRQIKLNLN